MGCRVGQLVCPRQAAVNKQRRFTSGCRNGGVEHPAGEADGNDVFLVMDGGGCAIVRQKLGSPNCALWWKLGCCEHAHMSYSVFVCGSALSHSCPSTNVWASRSSLVHMAQRRRHVFLPPLLEVGNRWPLDERHSFVEEPASRLLLRRPLRFVLREAANDTDNETDKKAGRVVARRLERWL